MATIPASPQRVLLMSKCTRAGTAGRASAIRATPASPRLVFRLTTSFSRQLPICPCELPPQFPAYRLLSQDLGPMCYRRD